MDVTSLCSLQCSGLSWRGVGERTLSPYLWPVGLAGHADTATQHRPHCEYCSQHPVSRQSSGNIFRVSDQWFNCGDCRFVKYECLIIYKTFVSQQWAGLVYKSWFSYDKFVSDSFAFSRYVVRFMGHSVNKFFTDLMCMRVRTHKLYRAICCDLFFQKCYAGLLNIYLLFSMCKDVCFRL